MADTVPLTAQGLLVRLGYGPMLPTSSARICVCEHPVKRYSTSGCYLCWTCSVCGEFGGCDNRHG